MARRGCSKTYKSCLYIRRCHRIDGCEAVCDAELLALAMGSVGLAVAVFACRNCSGGSVLHSHTCGSLTMNESRLARSASYTSTIRIEGFIESGWRAVFVQRMQSV